MDWQQTHTHWPLNLFVPFCIYFCSVCPPVVLPLLSFPSFSQDVLGYCVTLHDKWRRFGAKTNKVELKMISHIVFLNELVLVTTQSSLNGLCWLYLADHRLNLISVIMVCFQILAYELIWQLQPIIHRIFTFRNCKVHLSHSKERLHYLEINILKMKFTGMVTGIYCPYLIHEFNLNCKRFPKLAPVNNRPLSFQWPSKCKDVWLFVRCLLKAWLPQNDACFAL